MVEPFDLADPEAELEDLRARLRALDPALEQPETFAAEVAGFFSLVR